MTNAHYKLDEEFELIKANYREFSIHYATYRENIFFRQSWERRLAIFDGRYFLLLDFI